MHTIRPATICDAAYLAHHLRDADKDELRATGWSNPFNALFSSLNASTVSWCALDSAGNPAALFGVAASPVAAVGIPWLLGSDYLLTVPKETLRQTRRYVQRMHEYYPVLSQLVDLRNEVSINWMKWLGFKMQRVIPHFSAERRPFIHFVRKHHV